MLERWTNGVYRSTPHRVLNTQGISHFSVRNPTLALTLQLVGAGRERYSAPFFFEPNFQARVCAIPSCVSRTLTF